MKFFRCLATLLYKDLLSEFRCRAYFNSLLFFSLLVIFLFSFALGTKPELLRQMAPGLLWLVVLFSGSMVLERSFYAELDAGCLEGLLLYAVSPRALFLGKLFANFFFIVLVQLLAAAAMFFLFNLKIPAAPEKLLGVFLLGDFGLATLGTFYSILTTKTRARQVLLPLLLFPMLVPLLLGAVHATEFALLGDPFDQSKIWVQLMIVFDWIFFISCFMASAPLLEA